MTMVVEEQAEVAEAAGTTVVASATTVALHHLVLYVFLPTSVFNCDASIWSVLVHALFVVLESIAACFVARSFFDNVVGFEKLVTARTDQLLRVTEEQKKNEALMSEARVRNAREAGMAEVATGVLHNVGNALNSVNVSVSMITDKVRHSKLPGLVKASALLHDHATAPAFLTEHAQGRQLPGYLQKLSAQLISDHGEMLRELESLHKGVSHMTEIVSAQQTFAKVGTRAAATERVDPAMVMEEALALGLHGEASKEIGVIKHFDALGALSLDRHRLVQILVNLISNARHAVASKGAEGKIELVVDGSLPARLRFIVRDNGSGIAAELKVKIFTHGFTTRTTGHGFGLHASACAAMEMRGTLTCESPGVGLGSSFTIDLPLEINTQLASEPLKEAA